MHVWLSGKPLRSSNSLKKKAKRKGQKNQAYGASTRTKRQRGKDLMLN